MKRVFYLIIGTVLLLLLGLIYAWSVFISPLEEEFGWDRSQTSLIFTISMITFCIGGILGGYITGKYSPRVSMIISAICLLAGFLLSSRVTELIFIYISYGVLCGFGVGMAYNAIINTVTKWYTDKKGLSSGILLMGFGMGSFILGTIAVNLMENIGWRQVFIGIALLFSILVLLGAFLLKLPKSISNPSEVSNNEGAINIPPKKMLSTIKFWTYFSWTILLAASGLVIIGHATVAAIDLGAEGATAAMIMGTVSISNGVGRIVFGIIYDKFGLAKALLLINIAAFISPISLLCSGLFSSIPLLCVGFIFTGLFYGGIPTMNSTFMAHVFGPKYFAINFSIANASLLISPIIGPYIAGSLRAASGSYISSYIMMVVFAAVSFVILMFLRKQLAKPNN